jgi:dihydroxy-acid dehydratase
MESTWRTKGLYAGPKHAGTRALMKAGGLCEGDFDKPLIGVHNTYGEGGPGHIHLREITEEVRAGIYQAGGVPIEFGGPSHCPSLAPGQHDVPQRDIIAMSVENFIELHLLDAVVCVGSCDKPNPGHWLAASRLRELPLIMALGGPSLPGWYKGKRINASTALQAGLAYNLDPESHFLEEVLELESLACPGPGSCALCGTANTTALLSEALGLTLPGGGSAPAVSSKRRWLSRETGRRIVEMVHEGLSASKILKPEALENAIIVEHALGGSSNAIFHLLALAEDLGIGDKIDIDLIEAWGKRIPCIANVMPSGEYGVSELDEAGGVLGLVRNLQEYIHKDAMTVNGKTMGENLKGIQIFNTDVIRPLSNPVYDRGLAILKGNLATSAVVRYSVFPEPLRRFRGPAKVYNSQEEARVGLKNKEIHAGDAIVVKYEGPRGGPGMPDLFNLMYELHGAGLSQHCPLITDGKFSGFAQGPFICQVTPEAAVGGPLAVIKNGDVVEIDLPMSSLNVSVTEDELQRRLREWRPREPKVRSGYLTLWARFANSAAKGAGLPYNI